MPLRVIASSLLSSFRRIAVARVDEDHVVIAVPEYAESIEDSGLVYNERDSLAMLESIRNEL
jgi:hypothetical protein